MPDRCLLPKGRNNVIPQQFAVLDNFLFFGFNFQFIGVKGLKDEQVALCSVRCLSALAVCY